jgi:hypothetical protein
MRRRLPICPVWASIPRAKKTQTLNASCCKHVIAYTITYASLCFESAQPHAPLAVEKKEATPEEDTLKTPFSEWYNKKVAEVFDSPAGDADGKKDEAKDDKKDEAKEEGAEDDNGEHDKGNSSVALCLPLCVLMLKPK